MAKPDYATLLPQIAAETDSDAKQLLINQTYIFTEELTQAEKNLFGYVDSDYLPINYVGVVP
tara:strand:- start:14350 stop:14535 length:186 start_codon:yes stop_codon:yes gene_type:complete